MRHPLTGQLHKCNWLTTSFLPSINLKWSYWRDISVHMYIATTLPATRCNTWPISIGVNLGFLSSRANRQARNIIEGLLMDNAWFFTLRIFLMISANILHRSTELLPSFSILIFVSRNRCLFLNFLSHLMSLTGEVRYGISGSRITWYVSFPARYFNCSQFNSRFVRGKIPLFVLSVKFFEALLMFSFLISSENFL